MRQTRINASALRLPVGEAALISAFVLGLFYYWYAIADRYVVFLYGHVASGIQQTQPFDEVTSSRYWMCGLVASGVVMLLYSGACWLRARWAAWRRRPFSVSPWWQVWALCAIPLSLGIPAITMAVNSPVLPPTLALACVASTLLGLAVAIPAGGWAAERPRDLIWLAADGLGLVPALLFLRAIELPGRGLSVSESVVWFSAVGGLAAGLAWLVGLSVVRAWRKTGTPGAISVFAAGLAWSYLLMPLAHHLLATPPGYRYISTASNFFAFNWGLQLLALTVALGMALVVTRWRRLGKRPMRVTSPEPSQ